MATTARAMGPTARARARATLGRARGRSGRPRVDARAVDAAVALAVAQQDVAFAACALGEALVTRENTATGTPGRQNLMVVGPACGTLVGAFALIQSDDGTATPAGLAIAAAASGALLVQYAKRFDDTPRAPLEWPGPRLYPTLGVMFSLFALLANAEALPRILNPLAVG